MTAASCPQPQSLTTSESTSVSELNKRTNQSSNNNYQQQIKDCSTVLAVSNLIAAHGTEDDNLIGNNQQKNKASLSSLNSTASSESTILILQNLNAPNLLKQPNIDQKKKES